MKIAHTYIGIGAVLASTALLAPTLGQDPRESTTSFDGPPRQIDENMTPPGVGFNQQGGELSSTALEQAAIGNPSIHYHYYGTPAPSAAQQTSAAQQAGANTDPNVVNNGEPSSAPSTESTEKVGVPTQPIGYAASTYVTPITNSMNTSYHLYQGNIGSFRAAPLGQALATNAGGEGRAGSSNYYISQSQAGTGGIGDWLPFAANGTGTVGGANWGTYNGFD